jgi:hypothetical protein
VDIPTLQTAQPEFKDVDPGVIQSAIDRATRNLDPTVYGAQIDDAILLQACDYMTTSPMGGGTRLQNDPAKVSTYRRQLDELTAECGTGWFLVAGGTR